MKDPLFITIADVEKVDGLLPAVTSSSIPYIYLSGEGDLICPTCANLMKEGVPYCELVYFGIRR